MNKLSFIAYAIVLVFMGCGGDTDSTGGNTGSSGGTKPADTNVVNPTKDTGSSDVTKDKTSGNTGIPSTPTDETTVTKDKTTASKDKSSDTTVTQPSKTGSYKGGYAVKKITWDDGAEQSFSYNEAGKIIKIAGLGFLSTDTYEYSGEQLVKKGNEEYTYNGKGQLLTITAPGGVTTFSYNGKRQLVKKVIGSKSTTYSYNDNNGQLVEMNDNGSKNFYTYDDSGKLKSTKYSDNNNETVYSYGSKGELEKSTTAGQTVTYSYDYKSCTSDFRVLFTDLPSQHTSAMCRK